MMVFYHNDKRDESEQFLVLMKSAATAVIQISFVRTNPITMCRPNTAQCFKPSSDGDVVIIDKHLIPHRAIAKKVQFDLKVDVRHEPDVEHVDKSTRWYQKNELKKFVLYATLFHIQRRKAQEDQVRQEQCRLARSVEEFSRAFLFSMEPNSSF